MLTVPRWDSQSVKLAPMIFEDRGLDVSKKVNGRKKQLIVDTGGRIWAVFVHAANEHDSRAACRLLWYVNAFRPRLQMVLTDYANRLC